jgi:hypothetical protein
MRNRLLWQRLLVAGLLFFLTLPLAAGTITFTLLPGDGNVSGSAGSTVGWGYSITNNSDTDWYLATDLNPDSPFSNGTPMSLFDFPEVAPDATATEAFDPVNGVGLYELTWDPTAPLGFTNGGDFVLSGQWYDGDPFSGGSLIADAIDASAAYTATVGSGSTPEPSGAVMVLTALGVLMVTRRRHRRA